MRRNYRVMRETLSVASGSGPHCFDDFIKIQPVDELFSEIRRLCDDGLIESSVEFLERWDGLVWKGGEVKGLTAEGREFYRLVESDGVWRIALATLERAGIDISYPLLKEVCEEIVKRYVTSFIPEIKPSK